ncbi:O-FucT domain protein, partial [Rhizoctonia solani AG-3 Rhs1AP]
MSHDGSGVNSPLLLPTHTNGRHSPKLKSHVPRARRWLQFFGTAVITGIVFHLVLVGIGSTEAVRQRVPTAVSDWLPGGSKSSGDRITVVHEKPDCPILPTTGSSTSAKTQAQKVAEEEAPWTIDQLREMVSHTKGYYGRDYSLGLGWNNVRYIFEASLLHARLLNRTLVLPFWSNGAWHRENYQNGGKLSLHEIPNNEYDPEPLVRVEMLPSHPPGKEDSYLSKLLFAVLGNKRTVMDLEEAKGVLTGRAEFSGDDQLEVVLRENGWEVLHTFRGALGMDYTKSVVEPIKQVAPRSRLRGMVEDYSHITTDVLVLAGETHLNRKPGGVRFVHSEQRDLFASTVLHDMRPTGPVRRLADKIYDRMEKIVEGRQWMGAHMRRGDFVDHGWVMENSIENHLGRIKQRLSNGRKVLHEIYDSKQIQIYEVPNVEPEQEVFHRPPPRDGDSFYLATDERSKDGLEYIRKNGGVLISDLLTLEDRQDFGWGIMITDVLAIIEQTVLSRSAYFYAHAMSSVAGGVVNMRAARGADRRAALID